MKICSITNTNQCAQLVHTLNFPWSKDGHIQKNDALNTACKHKRESTLSIRHCEDNYFLWRAHQKESLSDTSPTFRHEKLEILTPSDPDSNSLGTPFPLFLDPCEPTDSALSLYISLMLDLLDRQPWDPLLLTEPLMLLERFDWDLLAK